jgi:hypothetical protein
MECWMLECWSVGNGLCGLNGRGWASGGLRTALQRSHRLALDVIASAGRLGYAHPGLE